MISLQEAFAPLKAKLPGWLWKPLRSVATGILTPILFSYRTGHFRSSLEMAAVSKDGAPIPWYTYPSIDFLANRSYRDKSVLEFGGGQSTLWWAQRARDVLTFEGDPGWYADIKSRIPPNVDLRLVSVESAASCVDGIEKILDSEPRREFDVIVIDGLFRFEMIPIARKRMSRTGMIVFDNSDGYGCYEGFADSGLMRVDFAGNAPGVVRPHTTSIFFGSESFAFDAKTPIEVGP